MKQRTDSEVEKEQREHGWKPCVLRHFIMLDHCGYLGLCSFYHNCKDDGERQKCQRAVVKNPVLGRWYKGW